MHEGIVIIPRRGTGLRRWGLVLCLAAATMAPTVAPAQTPVQADADRHGYTDAALGRMQPEWSNPFLSFLPADAAPAWAYWQARLRQEGQRRAARQAGLPKAVSILDEGEPPDARGWNDDPASAELVVGFGTGAGDVREIEVVGTLAAPAPEHREAFAEDDGSIPLANDVGLTPYRRIAIQAFIGDGPHGSLGSQSGDFDVYALPLLRAGQTVTIDIDTPDEPMTTRLDTKVALYDANGVIVDENDDGEAGSPDSFLEVTVAADGDYYVFVRGINSWWPSDPFDSSTGPKAGSEGPYTVSIGLDARDVDFYGVDLEAGDILGVTVRGGARRLTALTPAGGERVSAGFDASGLLPDRSPLPGGGRASLFYVADVRGRYALAAAHGDGSYTLTMRVFRPILEGAGAFQTLFLDFDGAVLDAMALFGGGHPVAALSPLAASLESLGLDPTHGGADESAVIDAVLATVAENLADDLRTLGRNPHFQIQILNSRDHPDPFGTPNVSRVVVGGTRDELGLNTIGIAESVDVGNFATEETAVVLLDQLTTSGNVSSLHEVILAAGTSIIDVLGRAVGNLVAHEAGHLFANYHTGLPGASPNLMDGNASLIDFVGLGADRIFGSADDVDIDFGPAPYYVLEGFSGIQDTRNAIAFGLFGAQQPVAVAPSASEVPVAFAIDRPYPNPFTRQTRISLRLAQAQPVHLAVYDLLGRRVRLLFDGWLPAGEAHRFTLEADGLPSGPYLIRATGASFSTSQPVLLVK